MLKILLVGCGRMGEALANGWLNQGRDPAHIWIVEPNQKSANKLISQGVRFYLAPDQLPPDDTPAAAEDAPAAAPDETPAADEDAPAAAPDEEE